MGRPRLFTILVNLRAKDIQIESFCRREFADKVKGFGEADVLASDEAVARATGRTAFLSKCG
jgi:hypothetical protein